MLHSTEEEQFDKYGIENLIRIAGFSNISIEAISSNYHMIIANRRLEVVSKPALEPKRCVGRQIKILEIVD